MKENSIEYLRDYFYLRDFTDASAFKNVRKIALNTAFKPDLSDFAVRGYVLGHMPGIIQSPDYRAAIYKHLIYGQDHFTSKPASKAFKYTHIQSFGLDAVQNFHIYRAPWCVAGIDLALITGASIVQGPSMGRTNRHIGAHCLSTLIHNKVLGYGKVVMAEPYKKVLHNLRVNISGYDIVVRFN